MFVFNVPPTAKVIWRRGHGHRLLKPGIELVTPGLQGKRFIRYTIAAPFNPLSFITQGISTHPAAYFPEINRYLKNTKHLERSECFPNLQKGEKAYPSNYRPISSTCVLCKILEHFVASSLVLHFTELDIFYEMQHGFREKRSCETQLILIIDELANTCIIWANRLILFFWT